MVIGWCAAEGTLVDRDIERVEIRQLRTLVNVFAGVGKANDRKRRVVFG